MNQYKELHITRFKRMLSSDFFKKKEQVTKSQNVTFVHIGISCL